MASTPFFVLLSSLKTLFFKALKMRCASRTLGEPKTPGIQYERRLSGSPDHATSGPPPLVIQEKQLTAVYRSSRMSHPMLLLPHDTHAARPRRGKSKPHLITRAMTGDSW